MRPRNDARARWMVTARLAGCDIRTIASELQIKRGSVLRRLREWGSTVPPGHWQSGSYFAWGYLLAKLGLTAEQLTATGARYDAECDQWRSADTPSEPGPEWRRRWARAAQRRARRQARQRT